jgi:hypothetical protein
MLPASLRYSASSPNVATTRVFSPVGARADSSLPAHSEVIVACTIPGALPMMAAPENALAARKIGGAHLRDSQSGPRRDREDCHEM